MNSQEYQKTIKNAKEIWATIGPVVLLHYKRTKTFLDYKNPWELLVAVILSAQTTDDMVNKVTPDLFAAYPTPETLAKAPIEKVEKLVGRLGFFRMKAKHIVAAARKVVENFEGVVPDTADELQTLPGVGRKTAVAVLSNAFNQTIGIPVDTHVIRFVARFTLTTATDPRKIEQDLLEIIPKKDWKRAGYAIKEYGRKEGRARGYKPDEDPLMVLFKSI